MLQRKEADPSPYSVRSTVEEAEREGRREKERGRGEGGKRDSKTMRIVLYIYNIIPKHVNHNKVWVGLVSTRE